MLAALSFVKVVRHTKLRSTCVYSVCMYVYASDRHESFLRHENQQFSQVIFVRCRLESKYH
jgi:hypothetical protein